MLFTNFNVNATLKEKTTMLPIGVIMHASLINNFNNINAIGNRALVII